MELLREADVDGEIGIDRMSPQTFLATLNASCCSYPVQLVGIDYGTDFLIKPWLERTLHRDLKNGEVILGQLPFPITSLIRLSVMFHLENIR